MGNNLPPGVTSSMLPGNTPMDDLWDRFFNEVNEDTIKYALDPDDAKRIWKRGLNEWIEDQKKENN